MAEGKAVIINIRNPSSFIPGVLCPIVVMLKNVGSVPDVLFARIINNDTGEVLGLKTMGCNPGVSALPLPFIINLTQTTDFHVRVDAGHLIIFDIPFIDEMKEFIIPVAVVEGKAVITRLEVPKDFVPGTAVSFMAIVKNTGGDDDFFFRIVNKDTGDIVCSTSRHLSSGAGWEIPKLSGVITQTTEFHGRAEAGHET